MTHPARKLYCLLLLACILAVACQHRNKSLGSHNEPKQQRSLKMHQLRKLAVTGDFDGDGKTDTLKERLICQQTNQEIDWAPDPFQEDWDTVAAWFHTRQATLYLTANTIKCDSLQLGVAQGLYCLINIGDNNRDGRDEIALVVDKLDDSRVNHCRIYSLCDRAWRLLKSFSVHEDAFNFYDNREPVFTEIKDFLERRNGRWVYHDYAQIDYDRQEDVGTMQPVNIPKCAADRK